ncbi:MAG: ChaN family lipoprotein [Desulfomicrobium sp.]|nr:ChaN family lipoprotein [Desulfomicrobium sp.]MDP3429266.1 ChaN family lipoprotein [Desulfomicrobium sp.]
MTRLILPLLLAMVAGCVKPAAVTPPWVSPPPGSFLSADASPLPDSAVVALAREAGFILMGESHTNPCDHAVQARLIEALAVSGLRFSIGLEMLPVTSQPVLDRFNDRRISAADLGEEVDWEKLWGYSYSLYRPIFELAEKFDLPVAGLNIPRQTLLAFRDKGNEGLTQADRDALPRRIIAASPAQIKALEMQANLHQTMRTAGQPQPAPKTDTPPAKAKAQAMPGNPPPINSVAEKFYLVQALWDSMMAEQALAWQRRLNQPMLILSGGGHVEHGWGIEYRLRTLDPNAVCLAVMPVRDKDDFKAQTDASQRPLPGKQVFFHCAAQHKSRLGMNILFDDTAMRVESVDPGSRADNAGLMAGDVLLKAGDRELREAMDLHFAAMAASRQKKPLELTVLRSGRTVTLAIPLD